MIDFQRSRQEAFGALQRIFTVTKMDCVEPALAAECWLVELEFEVRGVTSVNKIIVALDEDFPLSLPRIFLDKSNDVVQLGFPPHVDTNNFICTFDTNTTLTNPDEPGRVVIECVRRAKHIIQSAHEAPNVNEYQAEFVAYWENTYLSETPVDATILSLIPEKGPVPEQVTIVTFRRPFGAFRALIYSQPEQFYPIRETLKAAGIFYDVADCFHLGELDSLVPPFSLCMRDVKAIVRNASLADKFEDFLNKARTTPVVTFLRVINGRNLVFGWKHSLTNRPSKRDRRAAAKKTFRQLLSDKENGKWVNRFSPQVFTPQRLLHRTAGDSASTLFSEPARVLVAGLGSVGSNLVSLLETAGVLEFALVDHDVLALENIGRHLLGFSEVGHYKTDGMRDYLHRRNPLILVTTRRQKVAVLADRETSVLSHSEYWFLCTGDANSEYWLAQQSIDQDWRRPTFMLWVEPHLAGGHCVYLSGQDGATLDRLFANNIFVHNVISNAAHETRTFLKREAGCQTTYLPFDGASLRSFLAAVFPSIVAILREGSAKSQVISWIGDLAQLDAMGIDTTAEARASGSYSIVKRWLC